MAYLMPLPLTVSCFSKIQIGFTSLALAHPDSPRQGAVEQVCVCVCVCVYVRRRRLNGAEVLALAAERSGPVSRSALNRTTVWPLSSDQTTRSPSYDPVTTVVGRSSAMHRMSSWCAGSHCNHLIWLSYSLRSLDDPMYKLPIFPSFRCQRHHF